MNVKKSFNSKHQQGFTLIETIIYIALLVLVLSAVMIAMYNMIASTDKSQYRSLIHNEGQFVIGKIQWALNGASSFSVSGTTLTIVYPSGPNKVVSLSGTKVQLDGVDLNGDIAPVSSLSFTPVSGTRPVEIQAVFRMNNAYYDETFTTKRLIR